jgi:hypothetical protein
VRDEAVRAVRHRDDDVCAATRSRRARDAPRGSRYRGERTGAEVGDLHRGRRERCRERAGAQPR